MASIVVPTPVPAGGLTNPRIKTAVSNKINGFSVAAKRITKLFDDIEVSLKSSAHADLVPEWAAMKDDYRKGLWRSRDLATDIATCLEQFGTAIIPLASSVSLGSPEAQEVINTIDFFISSNDHSGAVQDLIHQVQMLQAALLAFQQRLARQTSLGQGLENPRIKEIRLKIEILTPLLDSTTQASLAEGRDLPIAGFIRSLLTFLPELAWGILDSAMAANDSTRRLLGIFEAQVNSMQKSIDDGKAEIQRIDAAGVVTPDDRLRLRIRQLADNDIAEVSSAAGFTQGVTNGIRSDATDIKRWMSGPAGVPLVPKPPMLDSSFNFQDSVYYTMKNSLKDYAVGITKVVGDGAPATQSKA